MKTITIILSIILISISNPLLANDTEKSGYKQVSVHNKNGHITDFYDSETPVHRRESDLKIVEICLRGTLYYYSEDSEGRPEYRTPLTPSYQHETGKPFMCDKGGIITQYHVRPYRQ